MLLEVVFNLRLRGQRWVKVEAGGLVQAKRDGGLDEAGGHGVGERCSRNLNVVPSGKG